ncbi:hypothetical protein PAXRUDRAFT_268409 [Paxillus rubicundulus Ve08.2h10]|uniref:Uncharacterized protein n=1 Tax=Paxillus rubicundulus Ve08.2h10 TaxID=930991 RepID=A0A0D0DF88_9AGAM|nr:hypothetical protein PAXRUDRAFT_268409 [Paxillus rubicundulus Ve08.2h10]
MILARQPSPRRWSTLQWPSFSIDKETKVEILQAVTSTHQSSLHHEGTLDSTRRHHFFECLYPRGCTCKVCCLPLDSEQP